VRVVEPLFGKNDRMGASVECFSEACGEELNQDERPYKLTSLATILVIAGCSSKINLN
jgi:hypothetical protein